jgi:hypothetical protein
VHRTDPKSKRTFRVLSPSTSRFLFGAYFLRLLTIHVSSQFTSRRRERKRESEEEQNTSTCFDDFLSFFVEGATFGRVWFEEVFF